MDKNQNDNILITKIQRFSLHDGPGIRTTAFLKGCSLHCPWCCNPENIDSSPQPYIKEGVEGTYGEWYSPDNLATELLKDKNFYVGKIEDPNKFNITNPADFERLPGGVTFSGGEALLQFHNLVLVCERLKEESIHIAIETCLFASTEAVESVINLIDLFYVDVKALTKERCMDILGGNLNAYTHNLNIVLDSHKPIILRIPVIGGYTDDEENRRAVVNLIKNLSGKTEANILKIELLKEHNLGLSKYESLRAAGANIDIPVYNGVTDEAMERYKEDVKKTLSGAALENIPVKVCRV